MPTLSDHYPMASYAGIARILASSISRPTETIGVTGGCYRLAIIGRLSAIGITYRLLALHWRLLAQ
jgi:hypothetical protein